MINPGRITQSDWILYPTDPRDNRNKPQRSHSNAATGQATAFVHHNSPKGYQGPVKRVEARLESQIEAGGDFPHRPYGHGRVLKSATNAQETLDRHGSRDSSLLLDQPLRSQKVQRSFSDVGDHVPHYQAPEDPHAVYAQPSKVKRQGSAYVKRPEDARAVIERTARPSYPAPSLPEVTEPSTSREAFTHPPEPPPPPPVEAAHGLPPPEQRMTVAEEMEKIRRARRSIPSEGEETYARAGTSKGCTTPAHIFKHCKPVGK